MSIITHRCPLCGTTTNDTDCSATATCDVCGHGLVPYEVRIADRAMTDASE